jgi:prepilin-type N-terminal cleavage/methylation domain-containing protein/prepilin-type processing-associated H-X9-DG protein
MSTNLEESKPASPSRWPRRPEMAAPAGRGFTLIELLVVLALVAVGGLMLVPALARTRTNSPAIQCLNNLAQLQRAFTMYAADHSGKLVPNNASGGLPPTYPDYKSWCTGALNWRSSVSNTNTQDLTRAALGPYTAGAVALYKCPADRVPAQNGPRIRSYAMNRFVGGSNQTVGYRIFLRDSDFTAPGPARTFVFGGEHPDAIDDESFGFPMPAAAIWPAAAAWTEVPASHHNGAGVLSFADGHVEIHQWLDANTKAPVVKSVPCSAYDKTSPNDNPWLVARTSAPL